MRESNPRHLLGRQRPEATRPTPLESRALCFALRLPVSMRRIVACAGLWAGVFGWFESVDPSLSVTCLPPALRRRQGQSELVHVDSGLEFPEQRMRPGRAITACRGTRIEWFSGESIHGGGIFTRSDFRSQAPCQTFHVGHNTGHASHAFRHPSSACSQTVAGTSQRNAGKSLKYQRDPDGVIGPPVGCGPRVSDGMVYVFSHVRIGRGAHRKQSAGWEAWDSQCLNERWG